MSRSIVSELDSQGPAYQNHNGHYAKSPPRHNGFLHAHDPNHLELLNTLTELQALNIENDFALPQIIVCGSQSSGKSSVLEAITEIPFPRSNNTCTRFVTKVTLRPHKVDLVEVKIEQGDPTQSQYSVPQFPPIKNLENLSSELDKQFKEAARAILGNQQQTKFSKDILSITISGPGRPILQILDLPGLILHDASDKKNIQLVQDIVESEMKKPHSTILAVVSAHIDFKNQGVLSLCAEHDSEGNRTLGIITRPDSAEDAQAKTCVAIAQGKRKDEVSIRHGWHVLRNRSQQELDQKTSIEERNAVEAEFFHNDPWARLTPENLGVVTLRTRLSKILLDAASRVFPELATKTKAQLEQIEAELKSLGGDNMTEEEKAEVFYDAAEHLKIMTNFYVEGHYRNSTSNLEASHPIHLRSRVVEQSELFRDRITKEGHSYSSQLEPPGINPDADLQSIAKESRVSAMKKQEPVSKSREMEIQEAKKYLNEKRGSELPGTYNPQHINGFFWRLSSPWNDIALEHIGKISEHCKGYFEHATRMAFAPDSLRSEKPIFSNYKVVADRVFELICGKLRKAAEDAEQELKKIEIDRTGFALNFDPQYLAKYRQQRNTRNAGRAIDAVVKDAALQNKDPKRLVPELNPNTLAELQRRHTQDDRTEEEAEDFLNSAWIHYRLMRDHYIANVLTQVIERHFMRDLSKLIPNIRKLDGPSFQRLVREDKNLEQRKNNLKQKRDVLQECLNVLERSSWI